ADVERDIKSFLSYAVGCMFGRYSLDEPGLMYAGGKFNHEHYVQFKPTSTNIIPITNSNYFADDVLNRLIEFLNITYGEEKLEENLTFITKVIGKRTNETAREAI